MKPDDHFISADDAIEYWQLRNFSFERVQLPSFEAYELGLLEIEEVKPHYDFLLLNGIGDSIEFYATVGHETNYRKYNFSKSEFIGWLKKWFYNDDLIIQSDNNLVIVFHHSGFIFYLRPN